MVLERLRNKLNNLKGESDEQHDDYIVALDIDIGLDTVADKATTVPSVTWYYLLLRWISDPQ